MKKKSLADLLKSHKSPEQVKLDEMAKLLFGMRHNLNEVGNDYLDRFMSAYVALGVDKVVEWFNRIWQSQKSKSSDYGDCDWNITKLYEGVSGAATADVTYYVQVMLYTDYVTCSPHNTFLIVKEMCHFGEGELDEVDRNVATYHIRKVWIKGHDYKVSNKFVNKPNIKWWKDRKWSFQYDETMHTTPLGGVHGDGRDPGYVLTTAKDLHTQHWAVEHVNLSEIYNYNIVAGTLKRTAYALPKPK